LKKPFEFKAKLDGLLFHFCLQGNNVPNLALNPSPERRILFHQVPEFPLLLRQPLPEILPLLPAVARQAVHLSALLHLETQGAAKVINRQRRLGLWPTSSPPFEMAQANQAGPGRQIEGEGKNQDIDEPGISSGPFSQSRPFEVVILHLSQRPIAGWKPPVILS